MIVNSTIGRVHGELVVRTSHPWLLEKVNRTNKRHYNEGAKGMTAKHTCTWPHHPDPACNLRAPASFELILPSHLLQPCVTCFMLLRLVASKS